MAVSEFKCERCLCVERVPGTECGPLRADWRLCVQSGPLCLVQVAGQGLPRHHQEGRHAEGNLFLRQEEDDL